MKYGKQNPLRLALPILKKKYLIVIPQRGGIWVGSDVWVTYGSPEDLIVQRAKGVKESVRKGVMRILKATGLHILKGSVYEL